MSYEFAGCLFDTRKQQATAAVTEYLSAGGLNPPSTITEIFREMTDAEILADIRENWELPEMQDADLLEALAEERSRYLAQTEDCGDSYNATIQGLEFTADKEAREWGLRPEDNWPAVEAAAEKVGIDPDEFWDHFEPLLNAAVGWRKNEER